MASESNVCIHCSNLRSILIEKENEIKKLKLHIQNLSNFILWKDSCMSAKADSNDDTRITADQINESDISELKFYSSDLFLISCDVLNKHRIMQSKFVQTDHTENLNPAENVILEKTETSQSGVGNTYDYVYDKNYQMYYSLSTGYYYDDKTGLMYEPQSGTYYRYNYDKNEYETVSQGEEENIQMNEDKISGYTCESVVNQVNNLNLNDESIKTDTSAGEVKNIKTEVCEGSTNEDENKNNEMINMDSSADDNVSLECTKDWTPTEGSKLTVSDMVRQVVDENNMSDYIYDESYQMYYSPSTGYFYDAIRKLLYDPTTGIYYFYDSDQQTYEFYCQTDVSTVDQDQAVVNADCVDTEKLTSRRKYWKRKLEHSKKSKNEQKSDEEGEDKNPEDSEEEEYSSPEDGEIFSSDNDSDFPVSIVKSPVKGPSTKQKSAEESYPPSIRAIVENSDKLQIGSLILITCYGGIVGRDKENGVYIPDICVSKAHAEIKYDNVSETYSIEDLGSQNGTFINDKRLSEPKIRSTPCTLNHGDKLAFGSCRLLVHIHEGYETCDNCEPGQVLAEISSQRVKNTMYISKEDKEKSRRDELRRLKKKYGLQGVNFERKATVVCKDYEDKAEIRRQTVGSDNPFEKTVEASIHVSMPETNKGYQMLKKMGWKEGQTLGAANSGLVEPIPLRPWTGKGGLGSSGDIFPSGHTEDKKTKRWVKAQERYFQLSLGKDPSS